MTVMELIRALMDIEDSEASVRVAFAGSSVEIEDVSYSDTTTLIIINDTELEQLL